MSGAEVSGEEQDEDGGAAIPPPAKRKVRGMGKKKTKHCHNYFQLNFICCCCRESGFVSMHHLKHRLQSTTTNTSLIN